MRILISNDDGIDAPGLLALAAEFSRAGHEVSVCAPDRQRSASSHSVTLRDIIVVKKAYVPGAVKAWAVAGTPADCVKIGVRQLVPETNFVLTGINHGYNMGTDVLYSGTVGAAMEAALGGCPAMAVSLCKEREDTYEMAAGLASRIFSMLGQCPLRPLSVLNLNIPPLDEPVGIRATVLRPTKYDDYYTLERMEGDTSYYSLKSWLVQGQTQEDDDMSWLARGFATLTVLSYNMMDGRQTAAWANLLNQW